MPISTHLYHTLYLKYKKPQDVSDRGEREWIPRAPPPQLHHHGRAIKELIKLLSPQMYAMPGGPLIPYHILITILHALPFTLIQAVEKIG